MPFSLHSIVPILSPALLALSIVFSPLSVWADDINNPEGSTLASSLNGTNNDDTIINCGTIGRGINALNGNDTIINHGIVTDGLNGQDGNDTLVNYGTANSIVGFIGNDTIINYGTLENIFGQDDDDTITHYGTATYLYGGNNNDTITVYGKVKIHLSGDSGTDSLTIEDGASVDDTIKTFEFITVNGDTTVGTLDLAGLDTMAVTKSSNSSPVTAGTVINAAGTLNAKITGGFYRNGQVENLFSTGAVGGFGVQTVTDTSNILSFTINNAQVTASRDITYSALVSGASDPETVRIVDLFDAHTGTATGNLAEVIGKLDFMSQDELKSAFRQFTGLDGYNQVMTNGVRMGSGATLARMDSMLASRRSASHQSGLSSFSATSPANQNQLKSQENLRVIQDVFAMIAYDDYNFAERSDATGLANSDNFASHLASQNIALPSAGGLGPSLNLGSSDAGGVWLRAFGSRSRQEERDNSYGYVGDTYGFAAGIDKKYSNDILAGIFGSWTRLNMDYDDPGNSSTNGNVFQLGVYSAWGPDDWFVETALAATYGNWDSNRHIFAGGINENAISYQNVYGGNLAFTIGRKSKAGTFVITPVAGIEYTLLHNQGYTEKEAGALNLTVSSVNQHSLQSMAGLQLERPFQLEHENHSYTLTPAIKTQWLHEFLNDENPQYNYANMDTLSMDSPAPERDTLRLGTSLNLAEKEHYSSYISYETDITETYVDHSFAIGLRLPF